MSKKRVIRLPQDVFARPENEDWLKKIGRDVDTEGNPIPTIFDTEAEKRGEKFRTVRERQRRQE